MADSYASILDRQWDDVPTIQNLPVGSYVLRARNATHQPPKSEGGNESVLFVYDVQEALDDVDVDELKDLGANYDLSANRIFHRMWIESGSNRDLNAMRQHLGFHDIDVKDTIGESLKDFKGTEVVAYLVLDTYKSRGVERTDNKATSFTKV